MKLLIQYLTKERVYHSENMYSHVSAFAQVDATRIDRYSLCKRGSCPQRYVYSATFKAPDDAEFQSSDGRLSCTINRRSNPHFKPKKLIFVRDQCVLSENVK